MHSTVIEGEWQQGLQLAEQVKSEGIEYTSLHAPTMMSLEQAILDNNQTPPWEVSTVKLKSFHCLKFMDGLKKKPMKINVLNRKVLENYLEKKVDAS